MSKIIFIGFLILLLSPVHAEAIPNTVLWAAYCEGVVTEQLRVMKPNAPNGIDGKPMLAKDGKLILPQLANNPSYPLPNIDEMGKKISEFKYAVQNYLKQSPEDDSFTKMLFNAGVKDFDSDSIINAAQCKGWPTQEKRDICVQLTALNANRIADCIK